MQRIGPAFPIPAGPAVGLSIRRRSRGRNGDRPPSSFECGGSAGKGPLCDAERELQRWAGILVDGYGPGASLSADVRLEAGSEEGLDAVRPAEHYPESSLPDSLPGVSAGPRASDAGLAAWSNRQSA